MPLASMVRKVHRDRREAEDRMVTKALMDTQDPREKWVNQAPPAHQPTPHILPWTKVPEGTQDSTEPPGTQEPGGSLETSACQACLVHPSEMKMRREAYQARWDPKASQESRASPPCTPACRELTGGQGSEVPQGSRDHLAQTVSFSALKEQRAGWATQDLLVSPGLADRKDGKAMPATVSVQRVTSSLGVFRGHQDPRAFPAPMGNQGGKAARETPASMASPGSQDSREPLVVLALPGPKE